MISKLKSKLALNRFPVKFYFLIFVYLDAENYNALTVASLWAPVVAVSSLVFT